MNDGYTRERAAAFSRVCARLRAYIRIPVRAYVYVHMYTRARVLNADDCGGTRPESCLASVNNAGRGNGAISAHLLLNVRFAALPPPRHHPPWSPPSAPRGSTFALRATPLDTHPPLLLLSACHPPILSRPESALCYTARVAATLTALLGGLRAVAGIGRPCDPYHTSLFHGASFVGTVGVFFLETMSISARLRALSRLPSFLRRRFVGGARPSLRLN